MQSKVLIYTAVLFGHYLIQLLIKYLQKFFLFKHNSINQETVRVFGTKTAGMYIVYCGNGSLFVCTRQSCQLGSANCLNGGVCPVTVEGRATKDKDQFLGHTQR